MSKAIKLQNGTYYRLEEVREKRETFSQAIDRLLDLHTMMGDVSKTLGPSHLLKSGSSYI
ncbi:unnamed protein product [marine sediment metagenome]|uniref:Uncharacterized protein n=1 Tax=marine sediment metagenome TaxID=412755 RepID=X1Q9B7_9ZZZZ